MRKFSLANDEYEIGRAGFAMFKWSALDTETANQLGFEEQYLQFHRYLLDNLQSVPHDKSHYTPRRVDLSLRAGIVKAYVVFACSILEGVLASWGKHKGVSQKPEKLHKMPFGALLKEWCLQPNEPRREIAAIWNELQLLLTYRNFIHLGRASTDEEAYWKNVLDHEEELLRAVDVSLSHLSEQCRRW